MTLAFATYLDHLEEEADRLADAASSAPRRSVPTCPGWDLAALVTHLANVYGRFLTQIRAADPHTLHPTSPLDAVAPEALVDEAVAVAAALRAAGPDAPCWNFTGQDLTAGFVARRLAHETAVHRVDAELAAGSANPIERELAVDGVDERLAVLLPHHLRRAPEASLGGSLCLVCSDDAAAWTVEVAHGALELRARRQPADAVVVASASDLCRFVWNRPTRQRLQVTGTVALVEAWAGLPA